MLAEKPFYSRSLCLTYQKGSPLVQPIDKMFDSITNNERESVHYYMNVLFFRILLMQQSGIVIHFIRKATSAYNPCTINPSTKMSAEGRKPLIMTVMELSAAFVVLVSGLCMAFIAFIAENIVGVFKRNFIQQPASVSKMIGIIPQKEEKTT